MKAALSRRYHQRCKCSQNTFDPTNGKILFSLPATKGANSQNVLYSRLLTTLRDSAGIIKNKFPMQIEYFSKTLLRFRLRLRNVFVF